MASTSVTLSGTKNSQAAGDQSFEFDPVTNANASDATTVQAFSAATYAAVTIPAGSEGVWIIPPVTNTGTITLKGVTGDTGLKISKTKPFWLPIDSAASPTLGVLCANAISITFEWT